MRKENNLRHRREDKNKTPLPDADQSGKRAPDKGSLTLEAALVLPLFILCLTGLVSSLAFFSSYARQVVRLQEEAERAAEALMLTEPADPEIELLDQLAFEVPFLPFHMPLLRADTRACVRAWVGNGASYVHGQESAEPYVYLTEHESVYHSDAACTHLDLHVEACASASLGARKNADGAHYKACEKCAGHGATGSVVYLARRGDRYHNSASCSGLMRHVHYVPASEASHLSACSRCAAGLAESP